MCVCVCVRECVCVCVCVCVCQPASQPDCIQHARTPVKTSDSQHVVL